MKSQPQHHHLCAKKSCFKKPKGLELSSQTQTEENEDTLTNRDIRSCGGVTALQQHKTISFGAKALRKKTIGLSEFTRDEFRNYWYTAEELKEINRRKPLVGLDYYRVVSSSSIAKPRSRLGHCSIRGGDDEQSHVTTQDRTTFMGMPSSYIPRLTRKKSQEGSPAESSLSSKNRWPNKPMLLSIFQRKPHKAEHRSTCMDAGNNSFQYDQGCNEKIPGLVSAA